MYSIVVISVFLFNVFASAKDVLTPVPYHASVRTDKGHICSGAILGEKWIATVAHILIVQDTDAKLNVVVGTNQLNGPGDSYSVSKIFYYPKYNSSYIVKYDMALLKLDKGIKFGSQVKAISPLNSDTKKGANLVVTGWKTPKRDAGGPLVENDKLVGILNQFFGRLPALYSRVFKYRSWIKNTMSKNK